MARSKRVWAMMTERFNGQRDFVSSHEQRETAEEKVNTYNKSYKPLFPEDKPPAFLAKWFNGHWIKDRTKEK